MILLLAKDGLKLKHNAGCSIWKSIVLQSWLSPNATYPLKYTVGRGNCFNMFNFRLQGKQFFNLKHHLKQLLEEEEEWYSHTVMRYVWRKQSVTVIFQPDTVCCINLRIDADHYWSLKGHCSKGWLKLGMTFCLFKKTCDSQSHEWGELKIRMIAVKGRRRILAG